MGNTITVGRAKTSNGTGRTIPINDDLAAVLGAHRSGSGSASESRNPINICSRGAIRFRPIRPVL